MSDPAKLEEFRRLYPQQCANFEADAALSLASRNRFLEYLDGYAAGDYEDYLNVFFHDRANKQLGPPVQLQQDEILGSARSTTSFAARFTTANGFDHDPDDAKEYVRDLCFLTVSALTATLRSLFLPTATITSHLMWSYRNPSNAHNPFDDVDRSDLVCRLALPGYGIEHIAFGHNTPATSHIPTWFDAGLGSEWRPGGKTSPLPDCATKYPQGLPEVVHDPSAFHNISTSLCLV